MPGYLHVSQALSIIVCPPIQRAKLRLPTRKFVVKARENSANYLPDVVVYCDDAQFDERRPDILLTPILLVEVLSESTARIDREEKLDAYRQILTLRHYLMVHQNRVRVEHHRRVDEREWRLDIFHWRREQIEFSDLGIQVPLDEIYRRVDVPEGFVLIQNEEER
jgi:Uma2 family endonuclease